MSKHKSFFITGTSTNIGKTYISSLLVKAFGYSGYVSYMKPVQTGCSPVNSSGVITSDLAVVKYTSEPVFPCSLTDHVPYSFEKPCSPHLAASIDNTTIDIDVILKSYHKIVSQVDTLIVEGAGGVLVPLTDSLSTIDLIKALHIDVILVTTPNLGTLNHTFLTVNQLRHSGITLAGVIMNNPDNIEVDYMYDDNRHMIEHYISPVPFISVNYGEQSNEQLESFCKRIRPL